MRRLVLSLLRVRMAMKAMSIKGYFLCLFLIESMSLRGVQFVCVGCISSGYAPGLYAAK